MEDLSTFLKMIKDRKYLESWLTKKDGLIFSVLFSFASLILIQKISPTKTSNLAIFSSILILTYVAWYVLRETYWRTGKGFKIAMFYEGHRVPMEDWIETRLELKKIFDNNNDNCEKISLRLDGVVTRY